MDDPSIFERAGGRMARLRSDDGIALPMALLLATVMAALTMVAATSARVETEIARNDVNSKRALAAAEAGLHHAFTLVAAGDESMTDELSSDGTGGALVALGSHVTIKDDTYRFTPFGGGANDGYFVRAVDNWDESTGSNDDTVDLDRSINLRSIGRVGNAERRVEALVHLSRGPRCALVVDGELDIDGAASVRGEQGCVSTGERFRIPGNPSIDGGAFSSQALEIDGQPEVEGALLDTDPARVAYETGHSNQPEMPLYSMNPFDFGPDGVDLVRAICEAGGYRLDADGTAYEGSDPPGTPCPWIGCPADCDGGGAANVAGWTSTVTAGGPTRWMRGSSNAPFLNRPYFVEGSVEISGSPGAGTPWKSMIVALNSINVTGNPEITPCGSLEGTPECNAEPTLRNILLVSGNDISLGGTGRFGTPAAPGAILAHQQIGIPGNVTIYGFVAAGNGEPVWPGGASFATSEWNLVSTPSNVSGAPTITYDGLRTVFFPNSIQTLAWSSFGSW